MLLTRQLAAGFLVASLVTGTAHAVLGDIPFKRKGETEASVPVAVFPHWVHRIRYKCYACHPGLFEMKAGANKVTMEAIMAGKSCGTCHNGKIAWATSFDTCARCHRDMNRTTSIFEHDAHFTYVAKDKRLDGMVPKNQSCATCHTAGEPKSVDNAKACFDCHEKDMSPSKQPNAPFAMARAIGYRDAMHGTCISCHQKEGQKQAKPLLAECATCHSSQSPEP